jgi:D-aspartate ligase
MYPTAVVMNLFYTGLGIARSLGEHGIPVIGLTAQRGHYGNYTRYAKTMLSTNSRSEPEALLAFLLALGKAQAGRKCILFPTRDDDVVFLNRFRTDLELYYSLVIPTQEAVDLCLDKWHTYVSALRAGVATPKCWLIEGEEDLTQAAQEASYPCVLKPLAAHHWRQRDNWKLVGERKAIEISSPENLRFEYAAIAPAGKRVLLQEMVPGEDDCLTVTACYVDRGSKCAGTFHAQKLAQEPAGFGTGCIVQTVIRPELNEPTERLLREMRFSGVAEVEYKWDRAANLYKLIEVNPRPWDQHRLGSASGVDLIHLAYCDHAGVAMPSLHAGAATWKWIADDTFAMAVLRSLWRRDGRYRELLQLARGKRVYGIWSIKDPLPFFAHFTLRLIPQLVGAGFKRLGSVFATRTGRPVVVSKGGSSA